MEGLGLAANVIAVVELSGRIAAICVQYSRDVKHAKADIERFRREVVNVTSLLQHVHALLQGPDKTSLSTSIELKNALQDCSMQLEQLNTALDPGRNRKTMSKFGLRALKWPFETKEVEKAIRNLERCKGTISVALQVDQTWVTGSCYRSCKV